jgi:signal transduction histidine kinase
LSDTRESEELDDLCLLGDTRWVRLDRRWEQRLGWSNELVHLLQPEDAALVTRHLDSLDSEGGANEGEGAATRVWLSWTLTQRAGRRYALARNVGEARRAQRDRKELQRKLEHAQRHASVGLLVAGVAHDFNNVLSTVLGNASLAMVELSDCSPNHPVHRELEAIVEAAQFAASLCGQLMTYAGNGPREVREVDLSQVVRSLSGLLAACAGRRTRLEYSLAERLATVAVDPVQVSQVLMNLVMNGKDALGALPGKIEIRTGQCWYDAEQLATLHTGVARAAGEYVFIEVSDTGPGMSPRVRDHLFDPFFSTKGEGRGLGLAATLGIVSSHGGAIAVESELGRGTTFRILLPLAVP